MSDKINKALRNLMSRDLLEGNFDITEELVQQYIIAYGVGKESSCNKKINKKLAILNLIKYKRINGVPYNLIKEGWVYIMNNPAWEGFCKIGRTLDKKEREASMQTYSPFRDFNIEHYVYSPNAKKLESNVHKRLAKYRQKGEWFELSNSIALTIIKNTDV